MEYLTGRLTRYQRPVAIKVVDQLPRTPSLKISRALVREHYFDGLARRPCSRCRHHDDRRAS